MSGGRLRRLPGDFDRSRIEEIDGRLREVAQNHHVAIGIAVESGSRAWGFPSPDSDFDCRFIFVRRQEDYLSPWQKRDVIETPLEDDLDINGWELGKALKLLLKGNAVVLEWLRSPILYAGDAKFHAELSALAERFADRNGTARHYLHLGERQRNTYFADGKQVQLKKYFRAGSEDPLVLFDKDSTNFSLKINAYDRSRIFSTDSFYFTPVKQTASSIVLQLQTSRPGSYG